MSPNHSQNSPSLSPIDFPTLLQAYIDQPHALSALLASISDLAPLLEQMKPYIIDQLNHGDIGMAEQALKFAWDTARVTKEAEHIATADWCSGIFYFNRNVRQSAHHYAAARGYYIKTGQPEKEGRVLIGEAYQRMLLGQFEVAEQNIQRIVECFAKAPDHPQWPRVYVNYSIILTHLGRYDEALVNAQKGAELALRMGGRHLAYYGLALLNQGYAALFLGDFALVEHAMRSALELATTHGFYEIAGSAALNLARQSILLEDLLAGLHFLHLASQHFAQTYIEVDQATVALERARLYERLGMTDAALKEATWAAEHFALADIAAESLAANLLAIRLAFTLDRIGTARTLLAKIQDLLKTATPLQRLLAKGYAAHPKLQQNAATHHQALAVAEQTLVDIQQLGVLTQALEIELIAAQLSAQLHLPDVAQRLQIVAEKARQMKLGAVEQEACLYLARHQSIVASIPTLRRAADIIVRLRCAMPVEELKANLLTGHTAVYTRLIEAQLKRRQYDAAMLTLMEAKGGVWVDLNAPIPVQELSPAWVRIKNTLNFWRDAWRTAPTGEYRAVCESQIQALEDALTEEARQQTRVRALLPLPPLSAIQNCLAEGTIVLEFFVGVRNLWCCILTKTQPLRWIPLGKHSEVREWLDQFDSSLGYVRRATTPEQRRRNAHSRQSEIEWILQELYKRLFAPLAAYILDGSPLVIVPDSFLFHIPWSALYDSANFLSKRHTIVLAPSVVTLALPTAAAPKNRTIGHTPPYALGCPGDPALQFIDAELQAVRDAFPDTVIITPATSRDLNWPYPPKFLHIAAHAHNDLASPLLSYIELEDGPFLLADILQMNLHGTELISVSGCETGASPEQGGIVLALAGAFLCCGAQNVLASLWPVDDEATQRLMRVFYRKLREGDGFAQALQTAQATLWNEGFTHPYYFAAFQMLTRRFINKFA